MTGWEAYQAALTKTETGRHKWPRHLRYELSMQKKRAEGLPDWALGAWRRAVGTADLQPYDLRRHANDTLLAAGVDYEIRRLLMGQKPPGQNPNYLDFTLAASHRPIPRGD